MPAAANGKMMALPKRNSRVPHPSRFSKGGIPRTSAPPLARNKKRGKGRSTRLVCLSSRWDGPVLLVFVLGENPDDPPHAKVRVKEVIALVD